MSLPDSYTVKPNSVPVYFDTILDAQPPERFSLKFLENLGFTSTNDRLLIGILKDLGFLNADGVPQQRYYDFLDRSQSKQIVAAGIRDAFSDLFAVNTRANELSAVEAKNKLRTLYSGAKTNGVIDRIAKTFKALCEYADFSQSTTIGAKSSKPEEYELEDKAPPSDRVPLPDKNSQGLGNSVSLDSLQYHINIVLPETRDQGVYDAIFRSLREHLGSRHE